MRVVGLGKIHKEIKEIERQLQEKERAKHSGARQRNPSAGHVGQPHTPSRSVRDNQKITNRPPLSSREIHRGKDVPPPFPRVHREDVSREALDEYNLAWIWDPRDKDYIIIEEHLTRQELSELIQHAARLRERKERELAQYESKLKAEQKKIPSESREQSDARRNSERGRGRHAEQTSARNGRNHHSGYAYVPRSAIHTHVNQTQNNQLSARREVSTARPIAELPSPSPPRSPRSRAPSLHSRLSQPFSPPDYTSMRWPHELPPQGHGSRSRSGMSQAPAELLATSSRRAQEPHDPRPSPLSIRQGSRPFPEVPSISPASRRFSHIPAPSEDVHFASPPHRSESLAGARNRHPRQAVENVRQLPSQYARGSGYPRRERSPDFVRGFESRLGDTRAPGTRAEGRDGVGRHNSVRGYRAN